MRRDLLQRNTPLEWNTRVLTEDDFQQYCYAEGIEILERQVEQPAVYLTCNGKPTIFLNDQLRGPYRLFAGFHELAHYWLHPSHVRMYLGYGWEDMIEREADVVAACALIPRTMLTRRQLLDLTDGYGYPDWIISLRCVFFDRYRI